MKVIILSAGKGSRLKLDTPKSLIKIDDRRMFQIQLEQLELAGVKEENVTFVTGYKSKLFSELQLDYVVNNKFEKTGQVYSISCASKLSSEREVLVIYGDILFESFLIDELRSLSEDFILPSYQNFKTLWKNRGDDNFNDLETFKKDINGNLLEIGNKVENVHSVDGQFMGIMYFNNFMFNNFLKYYSKYKTANGINLSNNIESTHFLNHLIKSGFKISTLDYEGYFMELDDNKDLNLIRKTLTI